MARPEPTFEGVETPTDAATAEVVDTLLKTADLVFELQEGPAYKPVLADRLGVSKSTVYNWARELMAHDVIEKSGEGYRLTTTGRAQVALFGQWQAASRRARLLDSALTTIPDAHAPPEQLFWNADVVSAEEAITTALVDWLHGATAVDGMVPTTMLAGLTSVHGAIAHGAEVEFVVRPALLALIEDAMADVADPGAKNLDVALRSLDRPFSFALVLREEPDPGLALLLYSDDEYADALLTTDNDAALGWGRRVYDHYREAAEPVPMDDCATHH